MGICDSSDANKPDDRKKEQNNANLEHIKQSIHDQQIEKFNPQEIKGTWQQLEDHENEVVKILYLDENIIVSISRDLTIKIWDTTQKGKKPITFEGHEHTITDVIHMPDYHYLASSSVDNVLKIWSLHKNKCIITQNALMNTTGHPKVLLASYESEFIIMAGSIDDPNIICYDWKNNKVVGVMEGDKIFPTLSLTLVSEKILASVNGNQIKIWNLEDYSLTQVLRDHKEEVSAILPCENNQLLSTSLDKTIKLWVLDAGECKKTIEGHQTEIQTMNQIDDHVMATADATGQIKFWDIDEQINLTENKVLNLDLEYGKIKNVIRVNGKSFATICGEKTIQIWK